MIILLINYRYYEAGGPERYLFNVSELLKKHGHTVIPFSLKYSQNMESHYSEYFANPPGGDDNFYYKDQRINIATLASLVSRQFYSRSVYKKLVKLIHDTKPDVAYILHFLRKMSPSVIDACHDNGVPVILRISDFTLLCPQCCFYRDNTICELCQSKLFSSVKYKCVKGSLLASTINYAAYKYHDLRKVFRKVSKIVCPSNFTAEKFRDNYRLNKISTIHIPTFVSEEVLAGSQSISNKVNKSIGYWGRIDHDKGIHILLDAMKILHTDLPDVTLTLIGNGDERYVKKMKNKISDEGLISVTMIPFLEKNQLFKKIHDFDLIIVPSLWYDNMPNSLLEAQALGIPAIVSKNGSLKELVHHGFNGYHFESGNPAELAYAIIKFYNSESNIALMRKNSVAWAEEHYSPEKHYERLVSVFNDALSKI